LAAGGPWLLLALVVIASVVSAYAGLRRTTRVRLRLLQAERQAQDLQRRVAGLGNQLRAEQALIERLPDPVIVFGEDRSVKRLNPAAQTTLGPGMPSLLRHPSFRAALERAQAERRDQFADLNLPVPIARELHASVLALPQEGGPGQLLAVLSDRTRERAVERMRADFVANASHELRTPLATLIGFIDTLRGPAADDKAAQIRFLGIMAEQAQRMNRLIDDLLSLSRIEVTEHLPPSGRVIVAGLVERVSAASAPLLLERRITLQGEVASGLPDLRGEQDQLEQVLQNLIVNAINYGGEGGNIRIAARPGLHTGQSGVWLSVGDDGPGISRAHIPRLTERFYRVDTHRSRAVGGTGLGLAIVKHIVNRHRGHLAIESTEGVGTTVKVWLPS
jgi:two-component system phosphate regulon sensor histidine kinase PhoR